MDYLFFFIALWQSDGKELTTWLSLGQVMRKRVLCHMRTNNKGAVQPAHPSSLISTFVVRCLDSMICILVLSKF